MKPQSPAEKGNRFLVEGILTELQESEERGLRYHAFTIGWYQAIG